MYKRQFANTVRVFNGPTNASHTGCTGAALGNAQVGTRGGWAFSTAAIPAGSTICVQSTNLGVAEAKVTQ